MCLTPVKINAKRRVETPEGSYLQKQGTAIVPCNKCPDCLHRRSQHWVQRLMEESKLHHHMYFVTLTYDPEYMKNAVSIKKSKKPGQSREVYRRITRNGYMTLCKKDLQNFFKRLRYFIEENDKKTIQQIRDRNYKTQFKKRKVKYYACGEYGTNYHRPHFHAILFGATESEITKAWSFGNIKYGSVNGDSIAYTCKYMCKGDMRYIHERDDRAPEFSVMSKNLGLNYLTPEMVNWHKNNGDLRNYTIQPGGQRVSLPRYYKNKIFTEDEKLKISEESQAKHALSYEQAIAKLGTKEFYRVQYDAIKLKIYNAKQKQLSKRQKFQ